MSVYLLKQPKPEKDESGESSHLSFNTLRSRWQDDPVWAKKNEGLKNFEGGGCWVLALINAYGVLLRDASDEEIRNKQYGMLNTLLAISYTSWTQIPILRRAMLSGRIDNPVDVIAGGFLTDQLFPYPAPPIAQILRETFKIELSMFPNTPLRSYPEYIRDMEEGEPYLMSQNIFDSRKLIGHLITIVRVGNDIICYEPNSVTPIRVSIDSLKPGRPMYSIGDGGRSEFYTKERFIPLKVKFTEK